MNSDLCSSRGTSRSKAQADSRGRGRTPAKRGDPNQFIRLDANPGAASDCIENYEEWKARTLARLTSHFAAEAEASELTQAFFGRSASTGLRLLELLTRRYDVIAANPPYMGSKNMGGVVHSFLESTRFGCTDLFAAFIARALQLMSESGVIAFVSQSSVLYLTTFASLREEILTNDWLRTGAHLGPGGFEEISGEKVNTVLLIAHRSVPDEESRGVFVRAVEEENKEQALLRRDPESLHSFYQSKS